MWMFGSRTTVKKVRNSLTWFSHGSGASLAPEPLKGAAPWGITNAEKLQLSVFLPNELSLEDWYAGVYGLPTVWPEVFMMGADHLRKVAGCDFHDLRRKYVRTVGRS